MILVQLDLFRSLSQARCANQFVNRSVNSIAHPSLAFVHRVDKASVQFHRQVHDLVESRPLAGQEKLSHRE